MNQQKDVKSVQSNKLTKFKRIFLIFGIGALHLLFTIPAAIPLVLSIYIAIGCFYIASFLLALSPIILIIHYCFPLLPINFGIGNPPLIVELLLSGLLFIGGVKLWKVMKKVGESFHLKVKQLSTKFIEWNLFYINRLKSNNKNSNISF